MCRVGKIGLEYAVLPIVGGTLNGKRHRVHKSVLAGGTYTYTKTAPFTGRPSSEVVEGQYQSVSDVYRVYRKEDGTYYLGLMNSSAFI
jgi:hypothetical protein